MKRIYVELLKQELIKQHQYADTYIGVWDYSKNNWMINGNNGQYEWDQEAFKPYNHRQKYVSLTMYLKQWNNEYFKKAYEELVEEGILTPLYDEKRNKTLYRFNGVNYEEFLKEAYKEEWNNGPSCPTHLMKQDEEMKKSQWWSDLRNEFYKHYENKSIPLNKLQLHHKTNEAYNKCLSCALNSIPVDKAYIELKDDLELLTEEEHKKAHNRG